MHYSIHNPERLLSTSATVPVLDIAGRDLKARHPYELRVGAAAPHNIPMSCVCVRRTLTTSPSVTCGCRRPSQHPCELRVRAPDPHYIRISYVWCRRPSQHPYELRVCYNRR